MCGFIYVFIYMCICMSLYIYKYVRLCMYLYVHTYIHTYTHIYIHTQDMMLNILRVALRCVLSREDLDCVDVAFDGEFIYTRRDRYGHAYICICTYIYSYVYICVHL
jgi:hypothetical protein